MRGETVGVQAYTAFISYSHRDAAFAARLHRRLESYRLPRGAADIRRFGPVFKDREELPAAHDLSAQVQAALAASAALIVVCSPDAAASPWVAREIETFRSLHPERPILTALARGEPDEAFPSTLRALGAEPLAADFRKSGDGERLALLKLVAGLAGVGVDRLIQRDAQRRLRSVMAVTAAALMAMLAMGGMTAFALTARADAERQRAEAEGLVEFMLTDLRDKLREVGRLEVLGSVNDRAAAYYGRQDVSKLPAASQLRRAKLLLAIGEDTATRGHLDDALKSFVEAERITSRMLAAAPDNVDRLFAHAQAVYWLGYIDYRHKALAPALARWTEYQRLTRRLAELRPNDPDMVREAGFGQGNLCTLAVELEKDAAKAIRTCRASLELVRRASAMEPADVTARIEVANRHAWLGDAYELATNYAAARDERLSQEAINLAILKADPANQMARQNWIGSQRALGRLGYLQGDYLEALRRIELVRRTLSEMTRADPDNAFWRDHLAIAEKSKTAILAKMGD